MTLKYVNGQKNSITTLDEVNLNGKKVMTH